MIENKDLRDFARDHGVRLWEIAAFWGISEPTMTRMMRRELDSTTRERFFKAVDAVSVAHDEKAGENND